MDLSKIWQVYYTEGFSRSRWELCMYHCCIYIPQLRWRSMEGQGVTKDFPAAWCWSKWIKGKLMCKICCHRTGGCRSLVFSYLTTEGIWGPIANPISDNKGYGPRFRIPWLITCVFCISTLFPTFENLWVWVNCFGLLCIIKKTEQ
jgi:hypothetical protein